VRGRRGSESGKASGSTAGAGFFDELTGVEPPGGTVPRSIAADEPWDIALPDFDVPSREEIIDAAVAQDRFLDPGSGSFPLKPGSGPGDDPEPIRGTDFFEELNGVEAPSDVPADIDLEVQ
jgi:hypothetical protein